MDTDIKGLFGLTDDHVRDFDTDIPGIKVHPSVVGPLNLLRKRAARDGIDLVVASGFRSYHRQKTIFDEKWMGKRSVLDDEDRILDRSEHHDDDWLYRILRFSALPGASRHHWGTDIDVFDRSAIAPDGKLSLIPSEYRSDGIFAQLGQWLSECIERDNAEGFYRPYDVDDGGVSPEPWHLSFRPIAQEFYQQLSVDALRRLWSEHPELRPHAHSLIDAKLEQIFDRFIR